MKVKTKLIASSLAIALAAAGVSVGTTYALFTSNSKADVAVTAGKVKLTSEANTASLAVYSASLTQTVIDGDELAGTKEIDAADERWDYAQYASQKAYQATYYYEKQVLPYSGADGTGYYFKTNGHAAINADKNYVTLAQMAAGDRVLFNIDVKNESNIDIKYRLRFALNEDPSLYDDVHTLADAQAFAKALSYVWGDQSYSKWHEWSAESVVRTKTLWFDFELPILTGDAYQDKLAYFTFVVEAVQANAYTSDPVEPMEIDKEKAKSGEETTLETPTAEVTVPADAVPADTELHLEVEPNVNGGFSYEVPAAGTIESYDVNVVDEQGNPVTELAAPGTIFDCKIYLGAVELHKFYHYGQELTLVSSKAEIDLTHAYYCADPASDDFGYIFFKTQTFSPFTATYSFAGGFNTEEYPYLVSDVTQLKQISNVSRQRYATAKSWFKLANNITCPANNATDVSGEYAFIINFLNVDLDGDGHMLTIESTSTRYPYLLYQTQDANFHDCDVTINDQAIALNTYANTIFNNVDVYGYLNVGNNSGAYVIYCYKGATFTGCDSYVNIKGYGVAGSYNAIYVGYTFGDTITFNNCHNKGTIICGKAAMFVGNVHNSYSLPLVIINCSNEGTIQWCDKDSSQGQTGYYNMFVAGSGQCIASVTMDGTTYTTAEEIKALQVPTTGQGKNVWGPQDTTLAIVATADGTLEITEATNADAVSYEVFINTYCGIDEGGSRQLAVSIEFNKDVFVDGKYNCGLKALNFVDQYWLAAHPDAVAGTLAGVPIYTLNEVSYYYVYINGGRFGGEGIGAYTSVYVSCYDANNTPLAAASILPTA